MTTKAQRLQRRVAERYGAQFALERAVLNAARTLMGAVKRHGRSSIPGVTWDRFCKAETALHDYHASRLRGGDEGAVR